MKFLFEEWKFVELLNILSQKDREIELLKSTVLRLKVNQIFLEKKLRSSKRSYAVKNPGKKEQSLLQTDFSGRSGLIFLSFRVHTFYPTFD